MLYIDTTSLGIGIRDRAEDNTNDIYVRHRPFYDLHADPHDTDTRGTFHTPVPSRDGRTLNAGFMLQFPREILQGAHDALHNEGDLPDGN